MSGPIVRSGASPEFSKNWEKIFGKNKKSAQTAPQAEQLAKKAAGKKKKK
jgi:hypothetical protein